MLRRTLYAFINGSSSSSSSPPSAIAPKLSFLLVGSIASRFVGGEGVASNPSLYSLVDALAELLRGGKSLGLAEEAEEEEGGGLNERFEEDAV